MTIEPQVAWRLESLLGEGPIWVGETRSLWFVDIKNGLIHRYARESQTRESFDVGGNPSFILPTQTGSFIVGDGNALCLFDGSKLSPPILSVAMPPHNRTNDATVDPSGRLWFGTMDDAEQRPSGSLYCFDGRLLHETAVEAVVTNGPAITADGRVLYLVNSGAREIWRYRLDQGALLGEGEIFVRVSERDGYPDGIVTDSEDCVWVALWDGWGVRRYAPDGRLIGHIDFPCARVTKMAFGGDDLRTAFVTTARVGLSEDQLAQQPFAGSLFAFEAPVSGLPIESVNLRR